MDGFNKSGFNKMPFNRSILFLIAQFFGKTVRRVANVTIYSGLTRRIIIRIAEFFGIRDRNFSIIRDRNFSKKIKGSH